MLDAETLVRSVLTNVKPKGVKAVYKVGGGLKLTDLLLKTETDEEEYQRMIAARTWMPGKGKVCVYKVPPFGTGIALGDEDGNIEYLFSPVQGVTQYEDVTSKASETGQDALIFVEIFLRERGKSSDRSDEK